MKVAVLFNPNAGGSNQYINIGKMLSQRLKDCDIKTYEGFFGQAYLENAHAINGADDTGDYIKNLHSVIMKVIETGPELLICIGGDGFAAYIADAMIRNKVNIPLLGIGGGTANVGPLISIIPERLDTFDINKIRLSPIDAVEVSLNNDIKGYAFNDVIIGDTFLGTIDGQMSNIAVEPFLLRGVKRRVKPSSDIVTDCFLIIKNSAKLEFKMINPAQIAISPINGRDYIGKAITGALCLAAYKGYRAALALIDRVIVSMASEEKDIDTVTIEQIIFDEEDKISISGLSGNGHVIIDGNPFMRLDNDMVNIRYISNAITIVSVI